MRNIARMSLDKKAVKILMETYWSSAGWLRDPTTAPDDLAYAKEHGVMFDPIRLSHSDAVVGVTEATANISQEEVVAAFIASLGSRRLDLRSGLGTYSVARHFQMHHTLTTPARRSCAYCGFYDQEDIDLNVLNFERIKWGGVRHTQPAYIAFDLRLLRDAPRLSPTSADFEILNAVLETAASISPTARLADLDKALSKVLASNSAERRTLIGILGFAGILIDPSRPAFRKQFVPDNEREHTPWHKDDWPYPVQWWNGSFGIDAQAVDDWFPGARRRK